MKHIFLLLKKNLRLGLEWNEDISVISYSPSCQSKPKSRFFFY